MSFTQLIGFLAKDAFHTGNDESLDILYKMLYKYLVKLTGKTYIADEVAQEAICKAYRAWPQVRNTDSAGKWLLTIARNLAFDAMRGHLPPPESIDECPEAINIITPHIEDNPEAWVEKREELTHLEQALTQVTLENRTCMILFHCNGLTQGKIAALLKCSIRTVQRRIARGLEELRQALNGPDQTPPEVP